MAPIITPLPAAKPYRREKRAIFVMAALSVVLVAGGISIHRIAASKGRLRPENFPDIEIGMSQSQVESLLGGPPGNYGTVYLLGGGAFTSLESPILPPGARREIWSDDETQLEVYFDANGRVCFHFRRAHFSRVPGWLGI
jgi:hypothetical protein